MMRRIKQFLIMALAALNCHACSSECNVFDYPPEMQVELDSQSRQKFAVRDLKIGQGRYAQAGRRFKIQVKVQNAKKRILAQGSMSYEYPTAENYYRGEADLHAFPYPGNFPVGMAQAIIGMREGGVRRFTLNDWRFIRGNSGNAAFRKKATRYLVSSENTQQIMKSDEKGPMFFEVSLKKVCRPRYCLKTTYSIPAMRNLELIEKACD